MRAKYSSLYPIATVLVCAAMSAFAGAPPPQATGLNDPGLTPLGAEQAANPDGTIPAWTGGISQPPADYVSGKFHPDPYAGDNILFSIDANNMDRYRHQLSDGQLALLQAYPKSWRMNIYPSRRSASYPDFVYDALKRNAAAAELIPGEEGGVRKASISSPFPIPTSGVEAVWNHNLRWRGVHIRRTNGETAVTRIMGKYRVILYQEEMGFPYGSDSTEEQSRHFRQVNPDIAIAFKQKVLSPGLLAGNGQLLLESINPGESPRNTWVYSPDLRRVFRTPFSGFDSPAPFTDGLRTSDSFDMFNGSPELYDWQLLGKREMFIPYNAYRLHGGDLDYHDILQAQHINPQLARYELHRVWVVEGRLKPGKRHIYSKRVLYLDEDSWQIALTEAYDESGNLWRVSEGHIINFYEMPLVWTTLEVHHDLKHQRYLVSGLDNKHSPHEFSKHLNSRLFSPNALVYYVR